MILVIKRNIIFFILILIVFDFFFSLLELDDSILNDDVICYRILEKGSKCGGRLLVVSNGYIYGLKVYIFIMRIKLDN